MSGPQGWFEPTADVRQAAANLRAIHNAFLGVGFSDDQSFELAKVALTHNLKEGS